MMLLRRLRDYAEHDDPLTAACNRIALLVASNQPFYPLYIWWVVGGDWIVACWTFLSTPFFAAAPAIARHNARLGRTTLVLASVGNAMVGAKAFGEASGVELFLIPCGLVALLGFRQNDWRLSAILLTATAAAALAHGAYGAPLGTFDEAQYARFLRLNASSVAAITIVIAWSLGRTRASTSRR